MNKIGKLGEDIAVKYLVGKGFEVIERNFLRRYGEIDIIAKKDGVIRFVEVKAVSRENLDYLNNNNYRPEENVHSWKLKRLSRVIQVYLSNQNIKEDWQFDLCIVYIDEKNKRAKVKFIDDLVLEQ